MPPPLKPQVSTQQEELLWERGILSLQSSSGLIQAVIFYLIKSCGVFQGKDLRQLKTEHVNFGEDSVGNYVTIDFTSVVCGGRLVRHYDDPNNPRSLYKLLKTYIRYLANEGAFLVRPISSIKDYICYSPWPLGVSIIEHMVQTLMEEAGQGSRYGNISTSLLAVDVLKSYGAGQHCLSTWMDCLRGTAFCSYRVKILSGKIPDCSTINCRELNAEAGLIMSHLLDPPYPTGTSAALGEIKSIVEGSDADSLELSTQNVTTDTLRPGEVTRGAGAKSKSASNRDRLMVVKRGSSGPAHVRHRVGGASSNQQKKQSQVVRLKSKHSGKPSIGADKVSHPAEIDLTLDSDPTKVKAEHHFDDEEVPEVEIDLAGDLNLGVEHPDQRCNGDGESEPCEATLAKGKRSLGTENNEELSTPADKVPKMEQHFQELKASLCGDLEACSNGVEQREDITVDTIGEVTEECPGANSSKTDSDPIDSTGFGVNSRPDKLFNGSSNNLSLSAEYLQRAHSPQKRDHLSLVSGLERWLDKLKQSVNTGADADMNGLLLQATSQLKVIADKVMTERDEVKKNSSPNRSVRDKSPAKPASTDGACDSSVEVILRKHLETVQLQGSLSEQKKCPGQEHCDSDLSPDPSTQQDKLTDSSEYDMFDSDRLEAIDLEDHLDTEDVGNLASPARGDPSSMDLSPPVLSPQPPTEAGNERSNFLFKKLSPRREMQNLNISSDGSAGDILAQFKETETSQTPKTSVPDLVKFLESANLQMQSLLSPSPTAGTLPQPLNECIDQSKSEHSANFTTTLSPMSKPDDTVVESPHKNSAVNILPLLCSSASVEGKERTPKASQQSQSKPSDQSQSCSSWPVLRSVLEETLPCQTKVPVKERPSPAAIGNSSLSCTTSPDRPNSLISSIVPTAQSGMYTFQSDHAADVAFQSLTVVSGDKRSQVFTFPDLPLDRGSTAAGDEMSRTNGGASSAAQALRCTRSELCLGDYLPRGAVVPASSIKVLTQQGSNGLEVVLRFDFSKTEKGNF